MTKSDPSDPCKKFACKLQQCLKGIIRVILFEVMINLLLLIFLYIKYIYIFKLINFR